MGFLKGETMENSVRESQLVFIGKVLASYTHELKNHLAIINESNGLMGDLLEMGETESEQLRLRFKKINVTIAQRISEANDMARHLNSFAHRMDTALSSFNVNDLLIEELALIDRGARLKNIRIEKDFQADMPAVFNNPSLFQFVVCSFVYEFVGKLADGGVIAILSQTQNNQMIQVHIEAKGQWSNTQELAELEQMEKVLQFITEKMDIGIDRRPPTTDRLKIILTLPVV